MRRRLLLILLLLLILILALFLLFRNPAPRDTLTLYGNVDVREVDLGFRVAGRVHTLLYEEGDWVEPNALLACLDPQPYLDEVARAEAIVASTQASLRYAEEVYERRRLLVKDKSVSQEDAQQALSKRDIALGELQAAQATLAIAKANLSFTEVYAPTKGSILTRIREPGTVVKPSDPVYTLSVASPVWIRAYVTEPELGLIAPNMPATIYTDTPGAPCYTGHVGFISPVAEFTPKTVESTQLRVDLVYRIRIYADNPDGTLRQGMPVTVVLHREKR